MSKTMVYTGKGITGGEILEIKVRATGKCAEMLLKIADENIEKIFMDAEEKLKKADL